MRLSVICITKDAADTIEQTLASAAFADEIIVVDSGSTDATTAIARQHGARVVPQAWQGYGAQKNTGVCEARGEWVLFIDADERITPALKQAIVAAMAQPAADFYWLRIITVFLGRPLRHLYGHNPRLFRRQAGQWTDAAVHEQVAARDGTVIRLNDAHSRVLAPPLIHHSHDTVRSYLRRMHHYTTLDAAQMRHSGRHRSGRVVTPSRFLPLTLAARQLVKLLCYRRGFLDGWRGIVWCVLSSYYEYEMGTKFLELSKNLKLKSKEQNEK